MPERLRAQGLTSDTSESNRDTTTAEAAVADIAQQLSADPRRIAEDLTDRLNHRLFGVGLHLHGALVGVHDPHAVRHVRAALADLDLAITELRRIIFDLHVAPGPPSVPRPGSSRHESDG
ncbi:histidine kinase [Actinomadura chokoriensis]|uniref:histidine kinase n=1 Tax=Actinomadura chokoriensis TaxID=454156 RepID=UPI003D156478